MTRKLSAMLVLVSVLVSIAVGQYYRGDRDYYRRGSRNQYLRPEDPNRDRNGVPTWDKDQEFKHDVFTFVRVEYSSWGGMAAGAGTG